MIFMRLVGTGKVRYHTDLGLSPVFGEFGYLLSVGAICFEDRFCTSRMGVTGGGGCVNPLGDRHGGCYSWL